MASLFKRIGASYAAALICFAAVVLRDAVIITQTSSSTYFFELVYIASIAGGIGVNVITFGKQAPNLHLIFTLSVVGVVVLVTTAALKGIASNALILLFVIYVLWLLGAVYARKLLEVHRVFAGRIRDGVTSLGIAFVALTGLRVDVVLLIGVIVGTAYIAFAAQRWASKLEWQHATQNTSDFIYDFFLVNAANTIALGWALYMNSMPQKVFGVPLPYAVRLSMYAYQGLFIASFALVAKHQIHLSGKHVKWWAVAFVTTLTCVFAGPTFISVTAAPFVFALLHFYLVLFAQQKHRLCTLANKDAAAELKQ